ncbi:unnamed protein product [Aphanomyces euteiches]|nr:hypothetical protein Ae201684P_017141 [Aphanomyces euteiches]
MRMHTTSKFIADCSARLHLGHVPTTTAMVLAHRFYANASVEVFPYVEIGAACIFLATKITEKPRKLRDVMNVAYCVSNNTNTPVPTGVEYSTLKENLLDAEQTVLRMIRFDMNVALPYQYLLNYTKILGCPRLVVRMALTLTSDLYYMPSALQYPSHVIAASCIVLAIELLEINEPAAPPRWWYHFDTSDDDIAAIRHDFVQLYTVMPPSNPSSTGPQES